MPSVDICEVRTSGVASNAVCAAAPLIVACAAAPLIVACVAAPLIAACAMSSEHEPSALLVRQNLLQNRTSVMPITAIGYEPI